GPPGRRQARPPDRLDGHLPVRPGQLLRPRGDGALRAGHPRAAPAVAGDDGAQQAGQSGPRATCRPARHPAGRGWRPGPGRIRGARRPPEPPGLGPRAAGRGPPPAVGGGAATARAPPGGPGLGRDRGRARRDPGGVAQAPGPCDRPRRARVEAGRGRAMKGQSDGDPGPGGVAHTALSALDELLADQRARLAAGRAAPGRADLKRPPAPLDDAELLLDLIYNEVVLREAAGESPRLEEYQGRFPRLAAALANHFEVHRAVGSGLSTAIEPRTSADAPVARDGVAV